MKRRTKGKRELSIILLLGWGTVMLFTETLVPGSVPLPFMAVVFTLLACTVTIIMSLADDEEKGD